MIICGNSLKQSGDWSVYLMAHILIWLYNVSMVYTSDVPNIATAAIYVTA